MKYLMIAMIALLAACHDNTHQSEPEHDYRGRYVVDLVGIEGSCPHIKGLFFRVLPGGIVDHHQQHFSVIGHVIDGELNISASFLDGRIAVSMLGSFDEDGNLSGTWERLDTDCYGVFYES